ncbi:hypothetical protein Xcel_3382 (plasmid) [Xylanimonas cellulosilytica DSM 15894]|uniref:Uncharacterized protein n=1 Tax=Xylanimonas cellulosilytica (strain DSM 15894 / JCM 12276 / CECT 5975 / KCTC 9989 / LMG 20990 / NBRC 107835 / XIL07) TaxID=446471 RepID=D1C0R5_XYLCX|nr:hypothetical protein [Xylanimonas cellulosilytica]ACZ32381.1 hypothetical protein Xcel_3382 [Xylanimonas cellulosilytica DSM 15894]
MYFQIDDTRVLVTKPSPLFAHAEMVKRHAVGQPVYEAGHVCTRLCSLFGGQCRAFLGHTIGPEPRPREFLELDGVEVDHAGTPTGREITFRVANAVHIVLYRALLGATVTRLWGRTAEDTLAALGHPDAAIDTNGTITVDSAPIGTIAVIS